MIGRTIGNYVVTKQIGQGGMGAVYLAEHPRIHRQVAIKVLLPEYSRNPQVVARFFNEAKAANEIRNEHIIDIIDFGELPEDGASYIIMEWLDGRSLTDELGADAKLPLPRAVHITRGIARALAAAHAHGIVHRDLKPDNIFLVQRGDDRDFVKVLDFGIAKLIQRETAAPDVKTQTGAIIGTPAFMSPEQCRGIAIDHRTDIYALGCICYRMLTGRLPFNAEGLGELLLQHMTEQPAPLRTLEPSIPPTVEAAVLRALHKEVAQRFQSVDDMLEAMAGVQTGAHAILPASPSPGGTRASGKQPSLDTIGQAAGQAVRPPSGAKRPLVVAGGAVAVLAAIGATGWVLVSKEAPAPAIAQPVEPKPQPPAPREVPKPEQPATARVVIRATPPSAQILIDDAKVPNPFEGTFPRSDLRHRIVVKASGYRTESMWEVFNGDTTLEVPLVKGSGAHEKRPAPAVVPAPAQPATSPPTPAPEARPQPAKPPGQPDKTIYKGTKGTLITDFPE